MIEPQRWIPYCGEAPSPATWLGSWNLDPVLISGLLLAALGLWRAALRTTRATTVPRRRALWVAWGLTVLLYVSPLCALSSAFFTVRVVHHMALVLLLAPLLVFGLKDRVRSVPTPLATSTVVAALVFWVWHAPAPYAAALSSVPLYALMQFSILGSAVAFWLAVQRAAPASALAAILATTVSMGLLGALITFATRPLYPPHVASSLSWGVAPLEDQQLAGVVMWAPGSFAYLFAALWIGWRWMSSERCRRLGAEAA